MYLFRLFADSAYSSANTMSNNVYSNGSMNMDEKMESLDQILNTDGRSNGMSVSNTLINPIDKLYSMQSSYFNAEWNEWKGTGCAHESEIVLCRFYQGEIFFDEMHYGSYDVAKNWGNHNILEKWHITLKQQHIRTYLVMKQIGFILRNTQFVWSNMFIVLRIERPICL